MRTKQRALFSSALVSRCCRVIPASISYLVKLSPQAIIEQLRRDPSVHFVRASQTPLLSPQKWMVELTRDGFLLYPNFPQQGLPATASSIRPTPIKQLYLRANLVALPQDHTRIHLSFAYKPKTARINFWLMWITCLAWVYLTGFTPAKLALVGILFVVTLPAFLFERRLIGGSQETRLELLNYMQHLVGPALLGENREENMPYRHEHMLPF